MAAEDLNIIINEARKIIRDHGEIRASDDLIVQVGNFNIPQIFLGNQPIVADYTVVDKISEKLDCLTSFMYIAPEGLLRISTNLKDSSGKRLIGTLIDNNHPICISIKKGIKEIGRAWIINDFFETVDIPLSNNEDKAIIAFGIGRREISGEREIILFQVGPYIYGFNIMFINEVIKVPNLIRKTTIDNKYIIGMFSLRNEIIPLIDTNILFGFETGKRSDIYSDQEKIIIVQFETCKYGFLVDNILGLTTYHLKEIDKFKLIDMDQASQDAIDGVIPYIKMYENVIVLYADKLIQIISKNF